MLSQQNWDSQGTVQTKLLQASAPFIRQFSAKVTENRPLPHVDYRDLVKFWRRESEKYKKEKKKKKKRKKLIAKYL